MQVLEALQQGASHDALVCCAGYVLGEYGRLVPEVPTHVQFALLHERFPTVSNETKARPPTAPPVTATDACSTGVGPAVADMRTEPAAGGPRQSGKRVGSRVGVTLMPLFRIVRWMQGLLLTTYLKFLIADPEDASLRSLAEEVFDRYSR